MLELYYDAYSVAYFAVSQEMGCRTQIEFLESLYGREYGYLNPKYRGNKKAFISDVLCWSDYLVDKEELDKEFPVVEKDFQAIGRTFTRESMMPDYLGLDLFFMLLRLRILYAGGQKYVRMKLRTLLKHYGYKRRSDIIVSHIQECMMFYHIRSYLRGEQKCSIKEIHLDDMITFRIIQGDLSDQGDC